MTLFEKIIAREVPANIVLESEECLAFHDIAPQAPIHVLVIPKKPIPRIGEAQAEDETQLGKLMLFAGKVATHLGVNQFDQGFRLVLNHGKDAGEAVPHMHMHLLAGRPLNWPPG